MDVTITSMKVVILIGLVLKRVTLVIFPTRFFFFSEKHTYCESSKSEEGYGHFSHLMCAKVILIIKIKLNSMTLLSCLNSLKK